MNENYQEGFERNGIYYPKLKPVEDAIVAESGAPTTCAYYHYEPGNGTRYEVVFSRYPTSYEMQMSMAVLCPRNAAMVIPKFEFSTFDIDYMREKLGGMLEGDCYALIPLINHVLNEFRHA